jgi:hypothetical protein
MTLKRIIAALSVSAVSLALMADAAHAGVTWARVA